MNPVLSFLARATVVVALISYVVINTLRHMGAADVQRRADLVTAALKKEWNRD